MKSQLEAEWDALPAGQTRMQIDARRKAHFKFVLFKEQAFDGDDDLHPTGKEAALCIQCDPPAAFAGSGLTKLCCAAGNCASCPDFQRPEFELTATDPIKFFHFSSLPSCSRCGALDPDAKECAFCMTKRNIKQRGKVCKRSHQVLQECGFQEFWEKCFEELKSFRMHLFQVRSNCKKFVTGVGRQAVKAGSVAIQRGFTEALN